MNFPQNPPSPLNSASSQSGPLILLCLEKMGRQANDVRALATPDKGGSSSPALLRDLSRKVAGIRYVI
jgi:hypothetical protein